MTNYIDYSIIKIFTKYMSNYTKKYLCVNEVANGLPRCKNDKKYLLYIHIPFCTMFCPYCSFNKFIYNKDNCKKYYASLKKELMHVKDLGFDFDKLVIGGGTPLINEDELMKIIEFAKETFSIKHVSCETDPNHINVQTINRFKGLIDRLSVGVQTFDDNILKKLGRYEKFGNGSSVYDKLEKMLGILPVVSVDLIFNFPNQSEEGLIKDLQTLLKLSPEQTSVYPLMTSAITQNSIRKTLGEFSLKNEHKYFKIIKDTLIGQYPVRNGWSYSKIKECSIDEYVLDSEDYVGVGSGSFSYINNTLYVNEFELKRYSKLIDERKSAAVKKQSFPIKSQMYYRLMLDMFGGSLKKENFHKIFDKDIDKALFAELLLLKTSGFIVNDKEEIATTQLGDYLFLTMMKEFYIGMDKIRSEARKKLLV